MRMKVKPLPSGEGQPMTEAMPSRVDEVPARMPHPARNLGPHLKAPSDGEIVTSHHRGAKKPR